MRQPTVTTARHKRIFPVTVMLQLAATAPTPCCSLQDKLSSLSTRLQAPRTRRSRNPTSLLNGDTTRDFTLASATPISGTVRGLGNNPLANVNVNVYTSNGQFLGSAQTDANGYYKVSANGSVNIQFYGYSSSYSPNNWYMSRNGFTVSGPTTLAVSLAVV